MEEIANIIGIIGTALLIGSYFLLQTGRVKGDDWSYLWLNLAAAAALLFSLMWYWNTGPVILEIFWIGITLYGMMRKIRKKT